MLKLERTLLIEITHKHEIALVFAMLASMSWTAATAETYQEIVQAGTMMIEKGDLRKAEERLDQAVHMAPKSCRAYVMRAQARRMQHHLEPAIADVNTALKLNANCADASRLRGDCHMALKQYNEACVDFSRALTTNPYDLEARKARATSCCCSDRFAQAIEDLNVIVETYPSASLPLALRSMAYAMQGDGNRAVADLLTALKVTGGNLRVTASTVDGVASFGAPAFEAVANQASSRIAHGHTKDSNAYFARALCYYWMQKYKEAKQDTETAVKLAPKQASNYILSSCIDFKLHNEAKSLADAQHAQALQPREETGYLAISTYCFLTKQYDKTVTELSKILATDAKNAIALRVRARTYSDLGEQQKAIADLNQAIALDPKCAPAYLARAELFQGMHQWRDAINDTSKAIALAPSLADAYTQRAGCYIVQGAHAKAVQDLTKAIALTHSIRPLLARAACYDVLGQHNLAQKDKKEAGKTNELYTRKWTD